MNRSCSACNLKIDINNYKKDRTVCKICYNKNKRKNQQYTPSEKETSRSQHQPKIDNNNPNVSAHENHAYIVIGTRNVGKTFYMLKKLKK